MVLFLSFTAMSCDDDDDIKGPEREPATITEVQVPETANAGEPVPIEVSFTVRNECGRVSFFNENISGTTYTIRVYPIYLDQPCAQVINTITETYTFSPSRAGTYTLRFWAGEDQFIERTIVVQ
ncbi:MAG: hypothetical protein LPK07_13670 [Hymenobacteraceae bacterium]|nr:hypothetical protein [Hymenobacteraceae bacterium]